MAVLDLYRDQVLAHNRAPRRFGSLDAPTHRGSGRNAACGDALEVTLHVVDGRIEDLRFAADGCAIAIASASMLSELLPAAGAADVVRLRTLFECLLAEGTADGRLGDLLALAALREYPARRRCALLAFDAVQTALAADGGANAMPVPVRPA